jgi:hypothetical protein
MRQTKAQRLIKLFKASGLVETEKLQIDNLDRAKLVLVDGEVLVENEHGTQFDIDELSNEEVNSFLLLMEIH